VVTTGIRERVVKPATEILCRFFFVDERNKRNVKGDWRHGEYNEEFFGRPDETPGVNR
jgi:hypothetical protein